FDPLSREHIQEIVRRAAEKLGVRLGPELVELISDYTVEGRKAIGLLADAYGLALYRRGDPAKVRPFGRGARPHPGPLSPGLVIEHEDLLDVIKANRLTRNASLKASPTPEVGRVLGLAASGYLGSVLEIEAVALPARKPGEGTVRFNETAGSMTRDSVYNAASLVRQLTGEELSNYDVHVNVVGGGDVDGPSAGAAILVAIISAIRNVPVRQDVAVTGEISIRGRVKPVGGLYQKLYGARQAGVSRVVVPAENRAELPAEFPGVTVVPAATIREVLAEMLVEPAAAGAGESGGASA
ncbi:MAG: ATP-dependent protease, Lon family, partial [Firmicutes bacterium]|nr:ATP-dependent protease, Lon family [Bacillota bacterium]